MRRLWASLAAASRFFSSSAGSFSAEYVVIVDSVSLIDAFSASTSALCTSVQADSMGLVRAVIDFSRFAEAPFARASWSVRLSTSAVSPRTRALSLFSRSSAMRSWLAPRNVSVAPPTLLRASPIDFPRFFGSVMSMSPTAEAMSPPRPTYGCPTGQAFITPPTSLATPRKMRCRSIAPSDSCSA